MAAALKQLRRAIIAGHRISVNNSSIIINDSTRLDRSARTSFRSLHGRGHEYSLETIYFQYTFRDLPYNDYFQECNKRGVQHVIAVDKKDLVAYLTGRIDNCAGIVSDETPVTETQTFSSSVSPASKRPEQTERRPSSSVSAERGAAASDTADEATFATNRLRVRDQRSIDSVLMVKDWDFSSLREKLSQHVTSAKKGKLANATNSNVPGSSQKPDKAKDQAGQGNGGKAYDPRGDRYTSNEDRFWRENLGSDFHELGIDMSGSFKAKPSNASQDAPPERARDSRADARRPAVKEPPQKLQKMDLKNAIPIIIVPTGTSSIICSANAIEFLQNGHFMSLDEMRKKKVPMTQPGRLSMFRSPGGNCSGAEYHIVSNPNKLSKEEWDQVVAVVLSGYLWQFKQWPIFKDSTLEFFRRVQGFYFHYDDVSPTGEVNSWSIRQLAVSRARRHADGQVQAQFWNILDGFISRNRLPLRY